MNVELIKDWTKQHAPEIALGASIIFGVAALGYTVGVSRKAAGVMHQNGLDIDAMKTVQYNSKSDKFKAWCKTYGTAAWRLFKIYHPTLIFGGLSIGSTVGLYAILTARNLALSTAAASAIAAYGTYREKVRERFGADVDKELAFGQEKIKVDEVTVDEDGKEHKKKVSTTLSDISDSPYAFYFDPTTSYLCEDHSVDDWLFTISGSNTFANAQLNSDKILTIHDVLTRLDYKMHTLTPEQKKISLICGWEKGKGDDCVIFDAVRTTRKLENGEVIPTVLVDFNVSGCLITDM